MQVVLDKGVDGYDCYLIAEVFGNKLFINDIKFKLLMKRKI